MSGCPAYYAFVAVIISSLVLRWIMWLTGVRETIWVCDNVVVNVENKLEGVHLEMGTWPPLSFTLTVHINAQRNMYLSHLFNFTINEKL